MEKITIQEKENFIDQLINEVEKEVWIWKDFKYFLNDFEDYLSIDNFEDVKDKEQFLDEVENSIDEFIKDQEFIYNDESLDFLKENDLDFSISIEEAKGLGFDIEDINPSLLASLALQSILWEEIFYIFNRLKEEASK